MKGRKTAASGESFGIAWTGHRVQGLPDGARAPTFLTKFSNLSSGDKLVAVDASLLAFGDALGRD